MAGSKWTYACNEPDMIYWLCYAMAESVVDKDLAEDLEGKLSMQYLRKLTKAAQPASLRPLH